MTTAALTPSVTTTSVTDDQFVDVVVGLLRLRLREVSAASEASLRELLGRPEELGARVAEAIPAPSRLAEAVGPVYRQASLAAAWGCSRQAVSDLIKRRRLLTVTTSDGHVVVPAFQLGPDLRPLGGMADILAVLSPEVVDDWTLASWLRQPQPRLHGASVIDRLAAGDGASVMPLIEAARRRWAS